MFTIRSIFVSILVYFLCVTSAHAKAVPPLQNANIPVNCNAKCFKGVLNKYAKQSGTKISSSHIQKIFTYADSDKNTKLNKKEIKKLHKNWPMVHLFLQGTYNRIPTTTGYPGSGPQVGSSCVQVGRERESEIHICEEGDCQSPKQYCCTYEITLICSQNLDGSRSWWQDTAKSKKKSCECCSITNNSIGSCTSASGTNNGTPGGHQTDQTENGN